MTISSHPAGLSEGSTSKNVPSRVTKDVPTFVKEQISRAGLRQTCFHEDLIKES